MAERTSSPAAASATTDAPPADRPLVITRVFDAPRRLVFQAWTDPRHLAAWWGPHGFTNPVCEADARSGGAILIHMRGPDGTVYPMTGTFRDVVEPERLVFLSAVHDARGDPIFEVLNTVTFAEHDGKTTLTVEARVVRKTAGADQYLKGMKAGWTQSLERLDAQVAKASAAAEGDATAREVVITREFDAPRELVFRAWTHPEQLRRWYAPDGCAIHFKRIDVRPGGMFHSCVRTPDGHDCWCTGVYREIVAPERIVYTLTIADEQGNAVGPTDVGMDPNWPRETTVTVTLAERDGRTTLTLRQTVPESLAKRTGAYPSWIQMLNRLADELAASR